MKYNNLMPFFYMGAISIEKQFADIAFDYSRLANQVNQELFKYKEESKQLNSEINHLEQKEDFMFHQLFKLKQLSRVHATPDLQSIYPAIIPMALAIPNFTTNFLQIGLLLQTLLLVRDLIYFKMNKFESSQKQKEFILGGTQLAICIGGVVASAILFRRGIQHIQKYITTLEQRNELEIIQNEMKKHVLKNK